jgi:hypothetical protein
MADAWSKNNLTYLGGMALDSYHIWTKFPITRIEDLQGKKTQRPGPVSQLGTGTGAVGVAGTLNTYYEDIKSGVSDGASGVHHRRLGRQAARGGALCHQGELRRPVRGRHRHQQETLRQAAARGAESLPRSRRRLDGPVRQGPDRTSRQRPWCRT